MRFIRKIGFPISLVYALVVRVRNYLFDIGFFESKSFATPLICVGNLSVGGTGKTPMVEFLISVLKNDYKIAVLSRGYKRKSKDFVLAHTKSTVEELGDEPYQIYAKFPKITMAVDADRQMGISILENRIKPDVILLDDAYQHRRVKPDLSILLTSYSNLYCDDWYLPTGNLRDSKREAGRANLIVVTKCPPGLPPEERTIIVKKLTPKMGQKVLFSYLDYGTELLGSGPNVPLRSLKDKRVTLVTGIADPKPLVSFLRKNGIQFEHLPFKDHHFFTAKELERINTKEFILTTEKDYVRLKDRVDRLYYISVKHKFLAKDGELVETALKNLM